MSYSDLSSFMHFMAISNLCLATSSVIGSFVICLDFPFCSHFISLLIICSLLWIICGLIALFFKYNTSDIVVDRIDYPGSFSLCLELAWFFSLVPLACFGKFLALNPLLSSLCTSDVYFSLNWHLNIPYELWFCCSLIYVQIVT